MMHKKYIANITYYCFNHAKNFLMYCQILTELKNNQLGIISNGIYSDQVYKLKFNRLHHFFKKIIVPDHVGLPKPSKEIFLHAAQEFKTKPSNCMYIGDSYDIDYLGSKNSGMKGILLDRKQINRISDCNKIYSLFQLKTYL